MKTGVVYGRGERERVEVAGQLFRLRLLKRFLGKAGVIGLIVGIGGLLLIFWPLLNAEIRYSFGQTKLGKGFVRISNTELDFVKEGNEKPKPEWKVPDNNYSIYIPKIMAKSKVIPNVDPGNKKQYLWALTQGVAEAAGLSHPGEEGTTYLFAHSVGSRIDFARYNAIFYLLHRIDKGDEVEVVYKENLYKYRVSDKEVIEADNTKYLQDQKGEERLVLQTCFPPGTAWKRLIVIARRV